MSEACDSKAIFRVDDSPDPTSALETPSKSRQDWEAENHLFRCFPGWTWSQRSRDMLSWVWEYGFDIEKDYTRRWVCKVCIRKKSPRPGNVVSTGTQNAERHLWDSHQIQDPSGKRSAVSFRKKPLPGCQTIARAFSLDPNKPREQVIANSVIKKFDRTTFQRLLIEWVVESNISFRETESPRLRALFEYLNPSVAITSAHLSHDTVRKRVVAQFHKHKEKVMEVLKAAPGLLHISFDGWRSGNRHALYGVACFFRDESGKPHKLILGVPELTVRHYGDNIGAQILDILETYDITDKIGYFTLDDVSNCDTAMETIGKALGFEGAKRRGRCFGHIINLVVKAILFGSDAEAFEQRLDSGEALAAAEHELWRKKGPVGELHNLVVAINRSDLFTTLLRHLQQADFDTSDDPRVKIRKPLNVIVDNDTRWLSQLYMIRRALKLRPYLESLILRHKLDWEKDNKSKKTGRVKASAVMPFICQEKNKLTDADWDVLRVFVELLQNFEDAVKALEGDGMQRKRKRGYSESYGNVWDVISGYEFLLTELEKAKSLVGQYPEPEHFRVNINLAWKKLDEYYGKLDETPIYYTSLALHPAYRWGYFEMKWQGRPYWIRKAKSMVQSVWDKEYKPLEVVTKGNDEPVAKRQCQYYSPFDRFRDSSRITPLEATTPILDYNGDEYEKWQTDISPEDEKEVATKLSAWLNAIPRALRAEEEGWE